MARPPQRSGSLLGLLLLFILLVVLLALFLSAAADFAGTFPWWLGGPRAWWGWIAVLLGYATVKGGRWLWTMRIAPGWGVWMRQLLYPRRMMQPDPRDVNQLVWRDPAFDPQEEIARRERSTEYFLGYEDPPVDAPRWARGKPIVVTSQQLRLHMQVVGSTGAGKSVLVARPLAVQHIAKGGGLVLFTFKPDPPLLSSVLDACRRAGRLDAFRFLSLDPARPGDTYNPMLGGPSYTRAERVTRGLGMKARGPERYFVELARQLVQLLCDAADLYGETLTFRRCQQLLNETVFDPGARTDAGRLGGALPRWLFRAPGRLRPTGDGTTEEGHRLFMRLAGMDLRHATDVRQLFDKWSAIPSLNTTRPSLDLATALRENQILYLELTTSVGPEVAGQLAVTVLEHLVYSYQSAEAARTEDSPLFLVVLDEFAALAREEFLLLPQQARSFAVGFVVLHQALADLEQVSPTFGRQLAALMNSRVYFQMRDGRDARTASEATGTVLRPSPYSGVQEQSILPARPGNISARDIQSPMVEVNQFLRLPTLQTTETHAKSIIYDAAGVPHLTTLRPLPRVELDPARMLAQVRPPRTDDEPLPSAPSVAPAGLPWSQPPAARTSKTRRGHRGGRKARERRLALSGAAPVLDDEEDRDEGAPQPLQANQPSDQALQDDIPPDDVMHHI